jgi:hypothetical protein
VTADRFTKKVGADYKVTPQDTTHAASQHRPGVFKLWLRAKSRRVPYGRRTQERIRANAEGRSNSANRQQQLRSIAIDRPTESNITTFNLSRFAKRRPDGNRIGNNLDRLSTSPNDGRHCANDDNEPNNSTINSIRKQSTTLWRIRGYWCCTPVRIQRTRTRAIKLDDKRNESESCEIYPTLTIHRHRHCNWHLASCRHAPSSC